MYVYIHTLSLAEVSFSEILWWSASPFLKSPAPYLPIAQDKCSWDQTSKLMDVSCSVPVSGGLMPRVSCNI